MHFSRCWPVLISLGQPSVGLSPSRLLQCICRSEWPRVLPCSSSLLVPVMNSVPESADRCAKLSYQPKAHVVTHLHKMMFFLPDHPRSSPVRVSSHRISLLSGAFSQSNSFWFFSLFTLVTINNFCKINNPLYETAQVGRATVWFFFRGGGVLCSY